MAEFEKRLVEGSRDETQDGSAQPVLVLYLGGHINMSEFINHVRADIKHMMPRTHQAMRDRPGIGVSHLGGNNPLYCPLSGQAPDAVQNGMCKEATTHGW